MSKEAGHAEVKAQLQLYLSLERAEGSLKVD
jgi:hypothetical protein